MYLLFHKKAVKMRFVVTWLTASNVGTTFRTAAENLLDRHYLRARYAKQNTRVRPPGLVLAFLYSYVPGGSCQSS